MENDFQKMMKSLVDFKEVVEYCILNTEFKEDLPDYQDDLVFINKLITKLSEEKNPIAIKEIILESQTAKILTDYYRQGECGKLQDNAFITLRKEVKKIG